MTLKNLYNLAKSKIKDSGEIEILSKEFLGFSRMDIILQGDLEIENPSNFLNAISRREKGEPVQYILGHWDFDELDLTVKDKVLIPREDSLVLSHLASEYIGDKAMQGIDLCSGTGAIALSIAKNCKNAKLFALELFSTPLECLAENVEKYGDGRVSLVSGDVFEKHGDFQNLDFIVSNPPYIKSEVIPTLQSEVQLEPHTALDGGKDGLDFYRFIVEHWSKCLAPNGFMALEIGEEQGESLCDMMSRFGFVDIKILKDFNQLPRVVVGVFL